MFSRNFMGESPFARSRGKIYSAETTWIADRICEALESTGDYRTKVSDLWKKTAGIEWKQQEVREWVAKRCPEWRALMESAILEAAQPPPLVFERPLIFPPLATPPQEKACYRCHGEEGQFENFDRFMTAAEAQRRGGCRKIDPKYCEPGRTPTPWTTSVAPRPSTPSGYPTYPTQQMVRLAPQTPTVAPQMSPGAVATAATSPRVAPAQGAMPTASWGPQGAYGTNIMTSQAAVRTPTGGGSGGCPPGQFPAYPGGPCRGAVGAMPGLPGGLPGGGGMTASGFGMGSRRYPVSNLTVIEEG